MDAKTLSANFEARERATHELRSLTDEFAGKDMTAEAREKESNLLTAIADFDGRIKRGVDALAATENVTSLINSVQGKAGGKRTDEPTDVDRLRNLGGEGMVGRGLDFAPTADDMRSLEARAVDRPGNPNVLSRTLYGQLLAQAVERSTIMRNGASIVTTSSGEPIDFTVVTGRASASIVGENGNIPESNPSTIQVSVGAYKYAYASIVSSEFVADQALDLVGFLVGDAGPAIGDGMGRHFLTGTGTGQPKGIFTAAPAATATFAQDSADGVVADALIDLSYELTNSYRRDGKYVVADKTAALMRKLKDANGQYLWASGLVSGAPDTFNGKPVATDDGVPLDKVLFGDLSKYRVRLAGALRVERSVDYKFMNDQIVYRFIQRADGLLVDERAAKVLTIGAGA
ncbi:major capsid protein [Streptomyces phage Heather]|uniref:Major capsid protein n=1 Tax=Streptomyces phage Heather TaxID=2562343 RepID=A0A4D6E5I9_9CAUD|nr:major capsid protein [Streptomyces phage Heather]